MSDVKFSKDDRVVVIDGGTDNRGTEGKTGVVMHDGSLTGGLATAPPNSTAARWRTWASRTGISPTDHRPARDVARPASAAAFHPAGPHLIRRTTVDITTYAVLSAEPAPPRVPPITPTTGQPDRVERHVTTIAGGGSR